MVEIYKNSNKFLDVLVTAPIRDKVFQAETLMKQMPNQRELKHVDYFSYGLYARELYIPLGTTLVGKLHKYPQMNILIKGKLQVSVDDEIKILEAPCVICSPAGTKRIAHALEDSVWITIHATEETDVDKIEQHFIAQTEQEYLDFCKTLIEIDKNTAKLIEQHGIKL